MTTFIALLRGINVGKANRVPMADLRDLLGELGYTGVATLLNSGNVAFRAAGGKPADHAGRIAQALDERLRVRVPVVVKSARELDAVVAGNRLTFTDADASRLLVAFAADAKALAGLAALQPLVVPPEQFVLGPHAAYLLCAAGILDSRAGKALMGKAGRMATSRNWATVLKLQALVHTGEAAGPKGAAP